jgi:hypothetical protein
MSLTGIAIEPTMRKRRLEGDSPIIVGGGGGKRKHGRRLMSNPGDITFKHDDYLLDGDTYKSPIRQLLKVQVRSTNYPAGPNVRVEIEYRLGATTDKITINKDGEMGVTFNQNHFPYDFPNGKHHGDIEITKLTVGGTNITLPDSGNFEIIAHTKLKARQRS